MKNTRLTQSLGLLLFLGLLTPQLSGESVDLTNGDRYSGTLLKVDSMYVYLKSEIQGEIRLPRSKVTRITFRPGPNISPQKSIETPSTPIAPQPQPLQPLASPDDIIKQIQKDGIDSTTVNQVREQFLAGMSPEVVDMFSKTVSGLMQGTISVGDIRNQAQESADQIRELKVDLGEEAGDLLDGYLFILEGFLNRTEANQTQE